ncbi:hypothetical protein KGQ19_18990 [Catenulispora sp. NL8]|uniref:Uncharacterized protein n=1 Tax=Catenulispora pinistramenti TaxID=2705254 RepID=A0ABS5KSE7_9ACTN|nr:hypothetical protein [Catenulispora pinistramenti]MBS2548955.1 hypothetical protein [Catenulispora pinistramenti]
MLAGPDQPDDDYVEDITFRATFPIGRDDIAAVVEAGGTYGKPPQAFPTARAYGAWAADRLLPNVIRFAGDRRALGPLVRRSER